MTESDLAIPPGQQTSQSPNSRERSLIDANPLPKRRSVRAQTRPCRHLDIVIAMALESHRRGIGFANSQTEVTPKRPGLDRSEIGCST